MRRVSILFAIAALLLTTCVAFAQLPLKPEQVIAFGAITLDKPLIARPDQHAQGRRRGRAGMAREF